MTTNARVVGISGELDLHSVDEASEALGRAIADRDRRLVIDLRRCSFIDSTGLATIIHVTRPLRENGSRVALVCPSGDVRKLLELAALNLTFPIHDRLEQALEAPVEPHAG